MSHSLSRLLEPKSIAVIGASGNAARIGGMGLDLLRTFGYAGHVYPVNPKYEEVFGYRCYPDVEALPEVPDLVVLAIGAEEVTPMLRRCAARGIPAAIVYAAGFAEAGEGGARLQADLEALSAQSGMLIAGPNCMGFANLNLHAYTAFASVFKAVAPQTTPGKVSVITQSGNVCSAVFGLIRKLGVPVNHFINTGNEACIEFAQYLQFLAQDPSTECVVGYVEELRDGRRFIEAASEFAERGKPLIIYKAGETERGAAAVRSHTSALAGDLAIYKAAFRQLNVIQANDFAQMADLASLAGYAGKTGGARAGIVTMSGALGAILADKLIAAGMDVPVFDADVQAVLRQGIPDYGMVSNPVDVTGNIVNSQAFVRAVFDALAHSRAIDVIVVYANGYLLDGMADALIETAAKTHKLIVAIDTGAAKSRAALQQGGIPVFEDIGRFANAFPAYCHWLAGREPAKQWSRARRQVFASSARTTQPVVGLQNEHEAKLMLQPFGVASVAEAPAADVESAVRAAASVGYPVVLKILSRDIAHKTEVGGVQLNLQDEAALRDACAEMACTVQERAPTARLDGFLVQRMSRDWVAELIVGAVNDPVFGPSLTVGLGGVLTELYRDASHRLIPVDRAMALEMLRELKSWPLLDGYRGRAKADVNAAVDVLCAVSSASVFLHEVVAEVEINPLVVRAEGQGAAALDALVIPIGD